LNADIQSLDAVSKPFTTDKRDAASGSNLFKTFTQSNQAHFIEATDKSELKSWKSFYESSGMLNVDQSKTDNNQQQLHIDQFSKKQLRVLPDTTLLQLHNTYIIASTNSGFILLHQQLAHERVLYERYSMAAHGQQMATQQSLFPVELEMSGADAALLKDLLPDLLTIGYQVESKSDQTFVIQGIPADILPGNEKHAIELLIEQFKHFSSDIKFSKREKLVRCMSRQQAIKAGHQLTQKEMLALIEDLFTCGSPNVTPTGSPTYLEFKEDYLYRMFGR
jgi:DNA mismatch repair protein MutL